MICITLDRHIGGSGRKTAYGHYRSGKRFMYARLFAALHARRPLDRHREVAHHVNGDPSDDRFENIAPMTRAAHSFLHYSDRTAA